MNPSNHDASGDDQSQLIQSLLDRIAALEGAVNAIGYDAKAAKKRRFPSHRRAVVMSGMTRALCVDTVDPWKLNRVRFFHPLLHDPNSSPRSLPFASPVSPMGGFDDCGLNWVPPAGSTLAIMFEGGSFESAFYLGTIWHKSRGPGGQDVMDVFPSKEYQDVHQGHRKGYLVGPNDESQVYPPWNTENYNSGDIHEAKEFSEDPDEQRRTTYPHIYGAKTPEKHMWKFIDGNAKCNRRWKRMEFLSSCGNWMIFKDDPFHFAGQWSHPEGGGKGGDVGVCSNHKDGQAYFSDIHGQPLEKTACDGRSTSNSILGGHPDTPCDPDSNHCESQTGSNKFFKHENEGRPYRGPGTPQNNKADLPQFGIQFLSISGHSFVMDDSVEEPRGETGWERSTKPFDFGCNDKYLGRFYIKSTTGHSFMMSDYESRSRLRGNKNFVRIKSASGNRIELNDETIGQGDGCPTDYAGPSRGITLESTSKHRFEMIDHMNLQCSPTRREGGVPTPKATKAYMKMRSGYGLELQLNDQGGQQETGSQFIQLVNPQCTNPETDGKCNSKGGCGNRGPHVFRMQGRPHGQAGVVFLRAGGHSVRQTYDMDVVVVGDKECNPSDKYTYVSRKHISAAEGVDFRYSGDRHILFAEEQILLMAGRDCPPAEGKKCKGPCMYNVIVARCPVFCPLTGILHWTEKAMSERVFASAYHPCRSNCGGGCGDYESRMAKAQNLPCSEDEGSIDTGDGDITINGFDDGINGELIG